ASKVKLFNAVRSQLFEDSVDVGLREDHGEASQVNVAESRSVNDELRLRESQIKLKEVGIRQAEAEAIAKEVGIRQAEAEAKAKDNEAITKEADSENLRLRIQLGQSNPSNTDGLIPRSSFSHFDPARAARLMLTFSEETVDEFFIAFERLATTLKCPIEFWPILLQQAFAGKSLRSWTRSPPNGASKFSTYTCSFCGKPGHKAEFCWTRLQPDTGKPAMIVTAEANMSPVGVMASEARESAVSVLASRDFDLFQESFVKDPDVGTFRPFLSHGTVEVDGVDTPVTILRVSGCLQTLIKEGVVAARKTDKYVVLGSLWGQGVAPLVLVHVKSSCFSGIANIACVHELPVAGVDLILGNDLAGGQMGNVTPTPVLRERPESTTELQQLEDDMPGVFPLCVVTRSMSMTSDHNVTPDVDDSLSLEGLFANPIASQDISSAFNAVTGRVALIAAQEQDDSFRLLFDQVSDSANGSGPTTRY
ncbi:hypothetical protein Hamer_G009986, partial [Homarus americanus]